MSGHMIVFGHPYFATTDEEGNFKITDIPPGTYKIRAWHEALGSQVKEVTVKAREEVKVGFEFSLLAR